MVSKLPGSARVARNTGSRGPDETHAGLAPAHWALVCRARILPPLQPRGLTFSLSSGLIFGLSCGVTFSETRFQCLNLLAQDEIVLSACGRGSHDDHYDAGYGLQSEAHCAQSPI